MRRSICLNADVGELPGEDGRALDRAILDIVTRCNIACGGHAGDDETMAATIHAAQARSVRIGAHPSYPDREGFGRSRGNVTYEQLEDSLHTQVRRLKAIARERGANIEHLKPHGSLYNDAAKDQQLAQLVAKVCEQAGITALVGPPQSQLSAVAAEQGLEFVAEAFADRSYEADGSLTPRSETGAIIADHAQQVQQVIRLVEEGDVIARTGEHVRVPAQTICLHGDTPGAAQAAYALKQSLVARGIAIEP